VRLPSTPHDGVMAPANDNIAYFAETTARAQYQRFGIKQTDRLSHLYVIGKTGVGKSTLLRLLALQDIAAGRGLVLVDPHGELAEEVQRAAHGRDGLIYLDATNASCPFGYNPLRRIRDDKIPLAASGILETFRKLWPDAWGVRMEHLLRNSLYALLERDRSILPDILRLYSDKDFRKTVTADVRNPIVRSFWKTEFDKYPERYKLEVTAPIQNKLGALLADPALRRILVAPTVDLHFRYVLDQGQVVVVNLSKGELGEDSASVLGSLLVSTVGLAALTRAETPADHRRPSFLYVDEFQAFTTLAFANMMAELRKYGLGLTLAHQHLDQLDPDIRHAVLGNAGTLITFRVGAEDASHLAKEYQPAFSVEDLINLPNRHFYLKLMIDGAPSRPFSARAIDASRPRDS
jgi:DNA helicase HerA-like ATPase